MEFNRIKLQALYLIMFVLLMIGLSYASVPLYKIFCQVTGYGGTPQVSEENNTKVISERVDVRFDSSTEKNSPIFFEPVTKVITTQLGKNELIFFKAINYADEELTGTATFNVTPLLAAQYFNKIECFCFEEQVFAPGQEVEMPVSFFIDPAIIHDKSVKDLKEITLSYTMYTTTKTSER